MFVRRKFVCTFFFLPLLPSEWIAWLLLRPILELMFVFYRLTYDMLAYTEERVIFHLLRVSTVLLTFALRVDYSNSMCCEMRETTSIIISSSDEVVDNMVCDVSDQRDWSL